MKTRNLFLFAAFLFCFSLSACAMGPSFSGGADIAKLKAEALCAPQPGELAAQPPVINGWDRTQGMCGPGFASKASSGDFLIKAMPTKEMRAKGAVYYGCLIYRSQAPLTVLVQENGGLFNGAALEASAVTFPASPDADAKVCAGAALDPGDPASVGLKILAGPAGMAPDTGISRAFLVTPMPPGFSLVGKSGGRMPG